MAWLIKVVAFFILFVFTNAAFACDEPSQSGSENTLIQTQHANMLDEHSSHNSDHDCDGKCCDKACNCKIGSCSSVWVAVSNESTLHIKLYKSFYTFESYYSFIPPPLQNRPPI